MSKDVFEFVFMIIFMVIFVSIFILVYVSLFSIFLCLKCPHAISNYVLIFKDYLLFLIETISESILKVKK